MMLYVPDAISRVVMIENSRNPIIPLLPKIRASEKNDINGGNPKLRKQHKSPL